MEARKEALRSLKACRFCLGRDSLTSIYDKTRQNSPVSFPLKIMACVNMEVYPSDGMPSLICSHCSFFIGQGYEFKKLCRAADEKLMQYVQGEEDTEPVRWPKQLLQTVSSVSGNKLTNKRRGKGRNEQSLQVQVSADSEQESNEDVVNIKIETDGGDDSTRDSSSTARIKVTQRGGKLHITEEEEDAQMLDSGEVEDVMVKKSASELITGKYPCRECNKVFPLKQLLHLHAKKHRERNFTCPWCPETFFTKNDMNVHMQTHSETPFDCAECGQSFKRLNLLKKHEKNKHPKYPCDKCDATFLSKEEQSAHILKHRDYDKRPFPCPVEEEDCNAKHLRRSHSDMIDKRTDEAVIDIYQCPECEESFTTQESLAYHEAQHAAQNMTCPLCQEHFDNVEAVTEHVKLHADQEKQFACDFCELVFVSEAAFEQHMCDKHSEEMDALERLEEEQEQEQEEDSTRDSSMNELPDLGEQKLQPQAVNISEGEGVEGEKATYTELSTVDTIAHAQQKIQDKTNNQSVAPFKQTAGILRKAEEVKRRAEQEKSTLVQSPNKIQRVDKKSPTNQAPVKKIPAGAELTLVSKAKVSEKQKENKDSKPNERKATEDTNKEDSKQEKADAEDKRAREDRREDKKGPGRDDKEEKRAEKKDTPSDKSLRMLERDLQELKRQSSRASEPSLDKPLQRGRGRPPLSQQQRDDKKKKLSAKGRNSLPSSSSTPEGQRRITQWTKDKRLKEEDKTKPNDKDETLDGDEPTRRSSRSSRVKDYAKMIKDSDASSSEEEYESEEEETPKPQQPVSTEKRGRGRPRKSESGLRAPAKTPVTPVPKSASAPRAAAAAVKRRGRPPLPGSNSSSKKRRGDSEEEDSGDESESSQPAPSDPTTPRHEPPTHNASPLSTPEAKKANDVVVMPGGQTLTKVPASLIKALPPGVKPRMLPADLQKSVAAATAQGSICEMKMGERTVKVQKIVMSKAEVQQMYKKGLVEIKHGAMVLKAPKLQGVKLPTDDPDALRSLVRAASAPTHAPDTNTDTSRDMDTDQPQVTPKTEESPAATESASL